MIQDRHSYRPYSQAMPGAGTPGFFVRKIKFQKIGEIDRTRLYIVGGIDDSTDMRDANRDSNNSRVRPAQTEIKTMRLNHYRSTDEMTAFEMFSNGEDTIVIDFGGVKLTLHAFTSGHADAIYSGNSYEEARKSLELSEQQWDDLLMSDVQYLELIN